MISPPLELHGACSGKTEFSSAISIRDSEFVASKSDDKGRGGTVERMMSLRSALRQFINVSSSRNCFKLLIRSSACCLFPELGFGIDAMTLSRGDMAFLGWILDLFLLTALPSRPALSSWWDRRFRETIFAGVADDGQELGAVRSRKPCGLVGPVKSPAGLP